MTWEEDKRAQEERERDAKWMKAHAKWMKEHFSPSYEAKRALKEKIFWTRWNRVREENMNRLEQKIEKLDRLDQLEESMRREELEHREAATATAEERERGKMVTALGDMLSMRMCTGTPAADTCAGAMRKRVRVETQEEHEAQFAQKRHK